MEKNNNDREELNVKKVSDVTRQMMAIMYELTPMDALDAFAKTAAIYIETCGKLGIDADELEETMCRGMHMMRKDVKNQFDRLRSRRPEDMGIKDMASFEADILERKIRVEQMKKDLVEKHPGELHTTLYDLKKDKVLECFDELKKVMERVREISPDFYHDKFGVNMEFLERQYQMLKMVEEKKGNKEQDSLLS